MNYKLIRIFSVLLFLIKISSSFECGKVKVGEGFISNANESQKGQWPWLVSLFYRHDNNFFCASSIISTRHLLSAAHCLHEKYKIQMPATNIIALLGRFDLTDSNEFGSLKANISDFKIHPDWDPFGVSYNADIAVLTVKNKIIFSALIQPVCLPDYDANVLNIRGIVVGYGLTEDSFSHVTKLRQAELSTVDHETCLYGDPRLGDIGSKNMFCTAKSIMNPCKGDSGGGFYIKIKESWMILGVVSSAASAECNENKFVLFTNAAKYINWVKDTMNAEKCGPYFESSPKCGLSKVKNLEGSLNYAGKWPWAAILYTYNRNDELRRLCGATLLNAWTLVTAAHCVQHAEPITFVIISRYNRTDNSEINYLVRSIEKIIIHKDSYYFPMKKGAFRRKKADADIALLIMETPVEFTDHIQPICLPSLEENQVISNGTLVGFGRINYTHGLTETPKEIQLLSVSNEKCRKSNYRALSIISSRTFCAKANIHSQRICYGDNGSGYFIEKDNKFVLAGIFSHSLNNYCDPRHFSVFVNVAKFVDWITMNMKLY